MTEHLDSTRWRGRLALPGGEFSAKVKEAHELAEEKKMELPVHSLASLFDQLGLASDYASIEAFIDSHTLPGDVKVPEAPFWSPAQAELLQDELQNNADWAAQVEELNERLHQAGSA